MLIPSPYSQVILGRRASRPQANTGVCGLSPQLADSFVRACPSWTLGRPRLYTDCLRPGLSGQGRATLDPRAVRGLNSLRCAPVAQMDRAFASGAKGRRFESCQAYQNPPWHKTFQRHQDAQRATGWCVIARRWQSHHTNRQPRPCPIIRCTGNRACSVREQSFGITNGNGFG